MNHQFKNTNTLYSGEFPPIDAMVEHLVNLGAQPEYWGVRPSEDDPEGVDRPYAYLMFQNQSDAYRVSLMADEALRAGYSWSLWAFFPGMAGVKTSSIDRQVGDLRYCLELLPLHADRLESISWLDYRNEASNCLIQLMKAEMMDRGRRSDGSGGIAEVR